MAGGGYEFDVLEGNVNGVEEEEEELEEVRIHKECFTERTRKLYEMLGQLSYPLKNVLFINMMEERESVLGWINHQRIRLACFKDCEEKRIIRG